VVSAVLVVGAALLAGGGLLLVLLQSALINTTQVSLDERARDVALLVQQSGLDRTDLEVTADLEHGERIQLLTPNGTVVQSSDTRLTVPMAPGLLPVTGQSISRREPEIPALDSDDDVLVVAYGFSAQGRSLIVQIGRPVQIQADTIRTVGWFLLGGGPLLLGVVAIATWVLVGRSLRTVDRITTQVSRIGGRSLDERIEVPRTADEIEHLARTMNSMLDRLQASDRAQKAFVSDASHELRSPLSTLMVTSEIASKDPTGKTWLEMGDLIDSEVGRMQSLVDDLLTLAKVDANGLMLRREEVDLDDLLQNEIRRLRAASRVRVRARIQPARAVGDPDRLAQVLRNVVDNARLHSRGQVAITLTAEDGLARILIDNDGPVIPEADRQRIFERFVRLDDDRSRDSGGSGLGLAISSAIMAAHDGRISATETDQGWCRFMIELPISTDQIKIDDQDDDDHPEVDHEPVDHEPVDHEPVDHEPGDQARATPEPANRDGSSSPDWSGVRR
jgi:signal transduction histidine kinase